MFAVTFVDETGKVEFGGCGADVAQVCEGGGEIEQKAVTAQNVVDVLPFGVVLVAFVCFIQQEIPFAVVLVIVESRSGVLFVRRSGYRSGNKIRSTPARQTYSVCCACMRGTRAVRWKWM